MPAGGGQDGISPCFMSIWNRDEGLKGCEGTGPPSMMLGSLWPEA